MRAKDFRIGLAMIKWSKEALKAECLVAYDCICPYCERKGGEKLDPDGRTWHLDRWWPGILGGEYEPCNVVLSCARCNLEKGGNYPQDDPRWDAQMPLGAIMFQSQVFTFLRSEE